MGREKRPAVRKKVSDQEWNAVPKPVRDALERGWPVIPIGGNKHPLFKWGKFKNKRPSKSQVAAWNAEWPNANWGAITGNTTFVELDFDGDIGLATMEKLKLKPFSFTPHGGARVRVLDVPFPVIGGPRGSPA